MHAAAHQVESARARAVGREYTARGMPMRPRTLDGAHRISEGPEPVGPGIVRVHRWHR